jgi:hypothetical protein
MGDFDGAGYVAIRKPYMSTLPNLLLSIGGAKELLAEKK